MKGALVLGLIVSVLAHAQDTPSPDKKGPVLYGYGGGRVWKWDGGEKTVLTPEGLNLVVGGVGEKQLWGWAVQGDRVRFFSLELPKKKDGKEKAGSKKTPPPQPVFDPGSYPIPDRADRVGGRLLLVYEALSGHPRYEVWDHGAQVAARAWDDGRVVYALALGPVDGWLIGGRDPDGAPWLEVSGAPQPGPEGWRGRLTVTLWSADDDKSPAQPRAAGWGAPGSAVPQALFWGPDGWTHPPVPEVAPPSGGTYPVLGAVDKVGVVLGGWVADEAGATRPWFWDGKAEKVGSLPGDGQPVALGSGKGGVVLVVRHPSSPWFTLEDGKASTPIDGLDPDDTVVAFEAAPAKTGS